MLFSVGTYWTSQQFRSSSSQAFVVVIKRQTATYQKGGELTVLDQYEKAQGTNWPIGNTAAECIVALVDRHYLDAPDANARYFASKIMFSVNNTATFLDETTPEIIPRSSSGLPWWAATSSLHGLAPRLAIVHMGPHNPVTFMF